MFPTFSEIPSIFSNIRHPRRRAISVGPQSEADAYETLAYREKRRRESLSNSNRTSPLVEEDSRQDISEGHHPQLSRKRSKLHEYETMMGTGNPRLATGVDGADAPPLTEPFPDLVLDPEPDEEEMFARIKRPRVRYDVEVVTKLVVYSGMWFFSFLFLPISDHD